MIKLHSLALSGYILFAKVKWQIDAAAITVIRGLNLDRQEHADESRNAVGKTLLPSAIVSLISGEPPFSGRKNSARDIVFGKAEARLSVSKGPDHFILTQYAAGKTVRYKVNQNGIDLAIKDTAVARAKISEIIPLKAEHLFSQFYISSYRPSVLWYGRAAERHDYFEQVFDLSVYDVIVKLFNKRKFALETAMSKVKDLELRGGKIRESLSAVSLGQIRRHMHKMQARSAKLLRKIESYNAELTSLATFLAIAEQLSSAASPDRIAAKLQQLEVELTVAEADYDTMQRTAGAAKAEARVLQQRRELKLEIRRLPKLARTQRKTLIQRLAKLDRQIGELQELVRLQQRHSRAIDKYLDLDQRKLPRKLLSLSLPEIEADLTAAQEQLAGWKHAAKSLSLVSSKAPCPTCGQLVSTSHIKQHAETLNAAISEAGTRCKQLRRGRFILKVRAAIPERLLTAESGATLQLELATAYNERSRIERKVSDSRTRIELCSRLKELPKPRATSLVSSNALARLARQRQKLRTTIERFKSDLRLHDKLAKLGQDAISQPAARARYTALQRAVRDLSPRLAAVNDKFSQLSSDFSSERLLRSQLAELDGELTALEEETRDRDLVAALALAYSPRGLRLAQVKALVDSYTELMNDNAPLIYPDGIRFNAEVDYGKFELRAERNNLNADVRTLSGSESRQFLVLSAYCLLHLMPDALRLDTIVLDEMENGMSKPELRLYTQNFIPALSQAVDHVVLITPMEMRQLVVPQARELLLVRQHGVTQLKLGGKNGH